MHTYWYMLERCAHECDTLRFWLSKLQEESSCFPHGAIASLRKYPFSLGTPSFGWHILEWLSDVIRRSSGIWLGICSSGCLGGSNFGFGFRHSGIAVFLSVLGVCGDVTALHFDFWIWLGWLGCHLFGFGFRIGPPPFFFVFSFEARFSGCCPAGTCFFGFSVFTVLSRHCFLELDVHQCLNYIDGSTKSRCMKSILRYDCGNM